eukprot:296908_1
MAKEHGSSGSDKENDFVYRNALYSFSFSNASNQSSSENSFSDRWTKLKSVTAINPDPTNLSQPIPLNSHEILIISQSIKYDIDLKATPTYLYTYNTSTGAYSTLTKYPTDFPRGAQTTAFDRQNGVIYIFTQKGYIVHYNIASKQWKWDIIHGISEYHSQSFGENTCSVMMGPALCVITQKQ